MNCTGPHNILDYNLWVRLMDAADLRLISLHEVVSASINLWLATVDQDGTKSGTMDKLELDCLTGHTPYCIP
jgi:hypothetical protein